jgi:hypothetical protein
MGQKPRKSQEALELENQFLRRTGVGANTTKVLTTLIKYGAYSTWVFVAGAAVHDLAGKVTLADFRAVLITEGGKTIWLPWLIAGGAIVIAAIGVGYGWLQRNLWGQKVEYLTERNRDLEKRLDPNRSSSRLTPQGNTPKEES